ncbi:uncharacterized protein [Rutidosis leptorrhynchoides]|uniref:uncharacterized protein n=1 Tax=Rutidosis leptorrhynchoides TaxID=125765 RepID=UPI003A9A3F4E
MEKWIYACLKSSTISVLINGSPTSEFSIKRGVRQGDPLSPFLFIIATEGLNLITKKATSESLFKGVSIGRNNVMVSNLQYPDDTIFLGDWCRQNVYNLVKLLTCFEKVSGLRINYHKSVIFGLGVPANEIELMANRVGCKSGEFPCTYLGIPIGRNMNCVENWNPVVDKFNAKLGNWKAKTVSVGGRAGRVGVTNLFRSNGWTLLPYGKGGLNIGSLRAKNHALLGKWIWRFKMEQNSLWVKIIKSVHGYNGLLSPLGLNKSKGKSGVWTNIVPAGFDIKSTGISFGNSFFKQIGNGADSSFWEDPWLGDQPLKVRFGRLFCLEVEQQAVVGERVSWENGRWHANWKWVRDPFGHASGELQNLISLLNSYEKRNLEKDAWQWRLASNGIFTTKKLSRIIDDHTIIDGRLRQETIRNPLVPLKVEIFM